jgi:tRNA A-37 threonylcarbamoyl transferase component Bud32/TolB-like protein
MADILRTRRRVKIRSSDQWQRIDSVFSGALPLSPGERAAYLDATCATDAELRTEVERLLASSDAAGNFLEVLDGERAAQLLEPFPETTGAIGRYKVVRKIGSGGMGIVYLADDASLKRQVAVKLLPPWLDASAEGKRRLIEEARAASAVDHPNIATVHEIGETDDGRLFIVMSYYEGDTLRGRLQRGHLSAAEATDIALQAARGLAAAHRKAIVHRDIKPENLLVKPDGTVKILDFGIARMEDRAATLGMTAIGTAAYMSPEQTLGSSVDARTDLWSLGVVLYEMLANERPFGGSTRDEVMQSIRNDPLPAQSHIARNVPAGLRGIVERCLRKEPTARYQSAEELGRDLESAAAGLGSSGAGASPQPRRFVRQYAIPAIAVAAGATAITVALAVVTAEPARTAGPSRAMVAVLPFTSATLDTALVRLGQDLVSTLTANLDGVGDLRAVDAPTVLARVAGTPAVPSSGAASALALDMGAGIVIRGSLARVGTRVRADGVLLDVDSASTLAHVSVTAPGDDLAMLTDSLTWGLLRQLSRIRGMPTLGVGTVSTKSLPALRAYLEGERLVNDYRMRAAAAAFSRAIAADSTFWFAYWRHSWAREFLALPVDSAITASYRAHLTDFPVPDRLLIEARMTPQLNRRIEQLESLVRQFPDYWAGWFALGELHVREAPFDGSVVAEADSPLRRAVALNADFVPGWDRLLWVSIAARDTVLSARVLGELKRLRYDSTSIQDDGFDVLRFYRYLHHLARTNGVPDAALADTLARALAGGYRPTANGMPDRLQTGIARFEFHAARIDLATRELKAGRVRPWFQWHVIASTLAARGAWDSALVAEVRAVQHNPTANAGLFGYRLAVVGAWLGAVEPSAAASWRDRATPSLDRMRADDRAELFWVDGLLATSQRDAAALARARHALRQTKAPEAGLMDSSLSAFASELSGDRTRGVEVLMALEREPLQVSGTHAFLSGVNRLTAARWLAAAGDTATASRLLTWHEVIGDPRPQTVHANVVLAPFAYLARARLLAGQGQWSASRENYVRFLANYDAPVQAHRSLVDEARLALTRRERP